MKRHEGTATRVRGGEVSELSRLIEFNIAQVGGRQKGKQ